jgi:hypothetical protein
MYTVEKKNGVIIVSLGNCRCSTFNIITVMGYYRMKFHFIASVFSDGTSLYS